MLERKLYLFGTSVTIGVFVLLFAINGFTHFDQNDHMYATAPTFLTGSALYRELPFTQAPLSIYLYEIVYRAVGPTYYYACLRALSVVLVLISGLLIFRTVEAYAGFNAALGAFVLFVASLHVGSASWEIGNYALSLALLSGAIYCYFRKNRAFAHYALTGLLIGLAAAARLSFALFALPFAYSIVSKHGPFSKEAMIYAAMGVIGSSLIWYYLLVEPSSFLFFNIKFHLFTNELRELGVSGSTIRILSGTSEFLIFMWLPIALAVYWAIKSDAGETKRDLILLAITAYGCAAAPAYMANQYLAPLAAVVCVIAGMALSKAFRQRVAGIRIMWLAILVFCIPFMRVAFFSLDQLAGGRTSIAKVATMSEEIEVILKRHLDTSKCRNSAVSLSPVPLLATSVNLSKIGATGIFTPQLADILAESAPKFAHHASMDRALKQSPPSIILLGEFSSKPPEQELLRYAQRNDFRAFEIGSFDGRKSMTLMIQAACMFDRTGNGVDGKFSDRPSSSK